ncbi:hypothetical protein Tco_0596908 [Tanacetum coccineum]
MATHVDGVFANGVVMIFEMDIAFYAIQGMEILSFMIRVQILLIILSIFHTSSTTPEYSCEFCGNDAHYGYDCPPQVLFIFDSLLDEFAGELTLLRSIPPGIDDDNLDPEGEIHLVERLLYDNSSPRPLEELNVENSIENFPLTNNEDKVFNLGILIHENLFEVTNCAKKVKNPPSSNASLILEDFYPPLYELPFHKEVLGLGALLSFLFENEEKVFNPGILTSKGVHTSLLPELSHRDSKSFKVIKNFKSPMDIFPCSYGEDIRVLDVSCLPGFLKPLVLSVFVLRSLELQILSFILGIQYPNLID